MKNPLKIMKHPPQVSHEELQHYMDFNMLLKKRSKLIDQKTLFLKRGIIIIGTAATIFTIWFYGIVKEPSESVSQPTASQDNHSQERTPKNTGVAIESTIPISIDTLSKEKSELKEIATVKKNMQQQPPIPNSSIVKNEKSKTDSSQESEYQYQVAEPIAGYTALYEYFRKELKYPTEALNDSIQGVVTVFFTINKEGNPEQIKIENSLGESFDQEVTRLIKNMPSWHPATVNNKPISSGLSLPLTFQIQTIKNKK